MTLTYHPHVHLTPALAHQPSLPQACREFGLAAMTEAELFHDLVNLVLVVPFDVASQRRQPEGEVVAEVREVRASVRELPEVAQRTPHPVRLAGDREEELLLWHVRRDNELAPQQLGLLLDAIHDVPAAHRDVGGQLLLLDQRFHLGLHQDCTSAAAVPRNFCAVDHSIAAPNR